LSRIIVIKMEFLLRKIAVKTELTQRNNPFESDVSFYIFRVIKEEIRCPKRII
jgi:hypothetical protein